MGDAQLLLLLIEDNPGDVRLLRELLKDVPNTPYRVESVDNIDEGLEKLRLGTFDLLLLDLRLPNSEPLTTIEKVLKISNLPIVILTGLEDNDMALKALQAGAQDYILKKDLTPASIDKALKFAMERQRSRNAQTRVRYLLQTLMDNIPDAIYFKDNNSRFMSVSRSLAKKHGLTNPLGLVGRSDADFFSEAHARQAREDEQKVVKTGQPLVGIEETETWRDGTVTYVSTTKMPLRDEYGRTVGTFGISRDITESRIAQIALAERTRQLAEKNRQIEGEMKMARELQLAMLPHQFPCVPQSVAPADSALEFLSFYFPSGTVSGDFFDVVSLSDTAVGVFICDVMGHDVRAALVTAMIRALFEDLCHIAESPGQLLTQINHALASVFKDTGTTMFATAFYMVVDVERGEILYANAAHPFPLQLSRSRGAVEPLAGDKTSKGGPAMGLFDDIEFLTYRKQMAAGDLVLLFTDGLIEEECASTGECFGLKRLMEAMQQHSSSPSDRLVAEVIAEIRRFSTNDEFTDDVCVVGVDVKRVGSLTDQRLSAIGSISSSI